MNYFDNILRNKFAKCTMMDLNSRRSYGKTSAKELSSRVDHIQCDQIFIQNCCGLFLGQLLGKLGFFNILNVLLKSMNDFLK